MRGGLDQSTSPAAARVARQAMRWQNCGAGAAVDGNGSTWGSGGGRVAEGAPGRYMSRGSKRGDDEERGRVRG